MMKAYFGESVSPKCKNCIFTHHHPRTGVKNTFDDSAMFAGIRSVAQKCDLSVATVSRALRGLNSVRPETRLAVERAAKAVG